MLCVLSLFIDSNYLVYRFFINSKEFGALGQVHWLNFKDNVHIFPNSLSSENVSG